MTKILIASNNQGKLQTASQVFQSSSFTLETPKSLNLQLDVPETGSTYKQNALLKAEAFSKLVPEIMVFADDSGITLDALPGQLGVYSRRYGAGPEATDSDWLDFFLDSICHLKSPAQRSASMQTTACLMTTNGPKFFTAKIDGYIAKQPMAPIKNGLPVSSVFVIPKLGKCMAELDLKTKKLYSHRVKAYKKLLDYLKAHHG